MITIKENIDNVEEFNYLFDEVGWEAHDYEVSEKALKNNVYSVSVYDDNKIIGYGRIIGDGIVYLHIHDVIVHPNYQGQGIGKQIVQKLIEKINELKKENPYLRAYLGSSLGKEDFYKKCGFITRKEAGLGPAMILK